MKPNISAIPSEPFARKSLSNGATISHDRLPRPVPAGHAPNGAATHSGQHAPDVPSEVTPIVQLSRNAKSPPRVLDKLAPLRNHPLFREFPPSVIEHFGTYMTRRSVRRGATIFAKGDPGTGLMAVLWGSVKISVPTADGREAVLNIINPAVRVTMAQVHETDPVPAHPAPGFTTTAVYTTAGQKGTAP